MLRAFKRAQAAVSLPVLEGALASADQGRLSQLGDVSAALLEGELSGPAPALNVARRDSRLRLLVYTSPSLAGSLGVTQSAAGAGTAAALCKTGVGMAKPIPPGPKGVIINEVIALRQQGLTFAQIRDKFGWKSTFKPHAIIKKYAPQLSGTSKTLAPGVPGTLPKPKPQTVPKPALRGVTVRPEMDAVEFGSLARRETGILSKAEANALQGYKGLGYGNVNRWLRGRAEHMAGYVVEHVKKTVRLIDKTFLTLENEVTVWRGGWRTSVKVGDIFADKAYISTSLSRDTARGFAGSTSELWRITVPRGAKITLPCCSHLGELEVLLARGSKLRVTGITTGPATTKRAGQRIVQAVLII